MTQLTDPAREILDLCKHISQDASTDYLQKFLARELDLNPWSSEFFFVLEIVNERLDLLKKAIESLSLEKDLFDDASTEIADIKRVFLAPYVATNTMANAKTMLTASKLRTLRLLAPQVRTIISYPYVEAEEREELCRDIRTLVEWLEAHQLAENDFIRGALIEGLNQAAFRLEKIHFFGWAYTAASLKPVIAAYMALDRMDTSNAHNPDAEIVLKKVREQCVRFYERMKLGKDVAEVGDFALRIYGAVSLAATPFVGIAGLLR